MNEAVDEIHQQFEFADFTPTSERGNGVEVMGRYDPEQHMPYQWRGFTESAKGPDDMIMLYDQDLAMPILFEKVVTSGTEADLSNKGVSPFHYDSNMKDVVADDLNGTIDININRFCLTEASWSRTMAQTQHLLEFRGMMHMRPVTHSDMFLGGPDFIWHSEFGGRLDQRITVMMPRPRRHWSCLDVEPVTGKVRGRWLSVGYPSVIRRLSVGYRLVVLWSSLSTVEESHTLCNCTARLCTARLCSHTHLPLTRRSCATTFDMLGTRT
jgi:hypothetical protein